MFQALSTIFIPIAFDLRDLRDTCFVPQTRIFKRVIPLISQTRQRVDIVVAARLLKKISKTVAPTSIDEK
jgi:hypothetical protein